MNAKEIAEQNARTQQAIGLACLHRVTQDQAKLLLDFFDGNIVPAKRVCDILDRSPEQLDFMTAYMLLCMGREK